MYNKKEKMADKDQKFDRESQIGHQLFIDSHFKVSAQDMENTTKQQQLIEEKMVEMDAESMKEGDIIQINLDNNGTQNVILAKWN